MGAVVGVPKEIKVQEYRVGLTVYGVHELIKRGHTVLVQSNAGVGVHITDEDYRDAGAEIVSSSKEIFERATVIVKVKEPQPEECRMLCDGQILFTFLHLAPDPNQAALLLASGVTAIAYETITDKHGRLPLLAPMSEIAGRMSVQAGAHHLEKLQGGRGVLLGGVPGVTPADVLVLGGGFVGINAARVAMGMGANVTIVDKNIDRLREINAIYGSTINTVFYHQSAVEDYILTADLVIGAVLVPGASAPKLITKQMLSSMRTGSVIVDVAIDQGGCFETSKATTHHNPTYEVDGVIHYCVANMPGAVANTSTFALTNATLPFLLAIVDKGLSQSLKDLHLLDGLNVHRGQITHPAVAEALGLQYTDPKQIVF